ncbi:alpha/beta hydrolase-fold protein [Streptomyces sp. SP17BM10]|uniref:alpha/beta hydrolase n=1 Tax=Streptomyces sp. SP17BM10 TaxID=3002530 RepID=UPI002E793427|nr:alpha/beta hydrolase-fold protein [Streptomyces sp. SP17BM10]MEE1781936.1 alpha/beta hydrolase-fold protein [Streptomyces sp. SP17BM10]
MLRQSSRSRAVLTGAAVLTLAASLAACGSSGGGKGDSAKAAGTPSASGSSAVPGDPAAATGTPAPAGTAPAAGGKVQTPTGQPALTKVRDTAAGPIMMTKLAGPKSGVTGQVWVWLPPEYNDPKYAKTGFPVLTLYAGGQSNGYNTWTDNQLPIQEVDEELAKAGKAHPFIMIMPVQNFNGDENNALDCSDIPGQPKMATWMAQDIPDWVRANFRTLKGRDSWGIMGASTGGFCSAKLSLQYPDVYKAAVPIDGYFIPDSHLWKGHDAERMANNPDVLVTQGKADVKMLVTAGGANAYEKGVVKSWVAKAAPPVAIEYYEQPGGKHLTSDFKKMIPDTLQWLTKNLAGPAAD